MGKSYSPNWPTLPIVAPKSVGVIHPPEGHFDFLIDLDLSRVAVRHLHVGASTAIEIDHCHHGGRIGVRIKKIQSEGENVGVFIGERDCLKRILLPAADTDSLARVLHNSASEAAVTGQS